MPLGSILHNLEITPGNGAQLVRSAGDFHNYYDKMWVLIVLLN